MRRMAKLDVLVGQVLTKVQQESDSKIVFVTSKGKEYILHHWQDCCESVTIESIVGDLNDLVGSMILTAEKSVSGENPTGVTKEFQDSFTWTFYKFSTRKGYVDIRWYGESNGYYSEEVDFDEVQ